MKVAEIQYYDGAKHKVERLGLQPLLDELLAILSKPQILLKATRNSNGGKSIREAIDAEFDRVGGWQKKVTGDVDWSKCYQVNGSSLCMGVEIQFTVRSDLVIMDIIHLRKRLHEGKLDLGVMVLPSELMSKYLTDRAPSIADGKRHVLEARADELPFILIAMEHDGESDTALAKSKTGIAARKKDTASELPDEEL